MQASPHVGAQVVEHASKPEAQVIPCTISCEELPRNNGSSFGSLCAQSLQPCSCQVSGVQFTPSYRLACCCLFRSCMYMFRARAPPLRRSSTVTSTPLPGRLATVPSGIVRMPLRFHGGFGVFSSYASCRIQQQA